MTDFLRCELGKMLRFGMRVHMFTCNFAKKCYYVSPLKLMFKKQGLEIAIVCKPHTSKCL